MSRILIWFAETNPVGLLAIRGWWTYSTREVLAIFGSLTALLLLIFIWVVFIRKPHRRHHRHHHHHSHRFGMNPDAEVDDDDGEEEEGQDHKHRHRRRRREHRTRNPTLAETGGLPPVRREGPPGAPPP